MYVSPISRRFWLGTFTPAMRAMGYPCLCLCRGFVQMTMVLPCRLITRHRSHMGLTEARTFISSTLSVGDSTASEVVGRQFHLHLVARKDADVVLSHLPRDLRQHLVPVVQLDAEHRAGKRLGDLAFDLDLVVLLCQLPRRNRAFSAVVGTRKDTALAAAGHGSKP